MELEQRSIERQTNTQQSSPEPLSGRQADNGAEIDIVKLYLNEAGKNPLLTHDEEITLGRTIQAGLAAKEEQKNQTASAERKEKLEELIENGGKSPESSGFSQHPLSSFYSQKIYW